MLKKLIEEDYKPKAILLPIDQTSFSENMPAGLSIIIIGLAILIFLKLPKEKKIGKLHLNMFRANIFLMPENINW
jgi:hypothetical protein